MNHNNVHWFLLEADIDSLDAGGMEHGRYTEALCRFLQEKEMEAG